MEVNRGRTLLPMSLLGLCESLKLWLGQIIDNDFNWSFAFDTPTLHYDPLSPFFGLALP